MSKLTRGALAGSLLLALLVPMTLHAQYTGPGDAKAPQTVAQILKNPVDDQDVVLRGYLVKKIGKEKYMFSDGTGEIRVEIEAEDFPAQQVSEKTKIELRGEVEKDFMSSPEIDVDAITVVQ